MDAWTFLDCGGVFANAQTGNVVLLAIELAAGRYGSAITHLPSLIAFIAGLVASSLAGAALRRARRNSRTIRLTAECAALPVLAAFGRHRPDAVLTACVGFIAVVQITSFSNLGEWSFNRGLTTGNLRSAFTAVSSVWLDPASTVDRNKALAFLSICLAFLVGATLGAWIAMHWHILALLLVAGLVAASVALTFEVPEPVPVLR